MTGRPDMVEFYLDDRVIAYVETSFAPVVNDLVSIKGLTYRVRSRNFALDHSDDPFQKMMRLAVNLEFQP